MLGKHQSPKTGQAPDDHFEELECHNEESIQVNESSTIEKEPSNNSSTEFSLLKLMEVRKGSSISEITLVKDMNTQTPPNWLSKKIQTLPLEKSRGK